MAGITGDAVEHKRTHQAALQHPEPTGGLLLGALFGAVFAHGRPGPAWPEAIVDALWPALAARPDERR